MITLSVLTIVYTIIGWSLQYRDVKRGILKSVDPFKKSPTLRTFSLVITTVLSLIDVVVFIVVYLP